MASVSFVSRRHGKQKSHEESVDADPGLAWLLHLGLYSSASRVRRLTDPSGTPGLPLLVKGDSKGILEGAGGQNEAMKPLQSPIRLVVLSDSAGPFLSFLPMTSPRAFFHLLEVLK